MDDSDGIVIGDFSNSEEYKEILNFENLISNQYSTILPEENRLSVIDEIDEEEILISIDIV